MAADARPKALWTPTEPFGHDFRIYAKPWPLKKQGGPGTGSLEQQPTTAFNGGKIFANGRKPKPLKKMKTFGTFATHLEEKQNKKQQPELNEQQLQQTTAATIKASFSVPIATNHLQPIAYGNIPTAAQSYHQNAGFLPKPIENADNVVFKHNELHWPNNFTTNHQAHHSQPARDSIRIHIHHNHRHHHHHHPNDGSVANNHSLTNQHRQGHHHSTLHPRCPPHHQQLIHFADQQQQSQPQHDRKQQPKQTPSRDHHVESGSVTSQHGGTGKQDWHLEFVNGAGRKYYGAPLPTMKNYVDPCHTMCG